MQEHAFSTTRTARYAVLGQTERPVTELWVALHGYGQLARYFIRPFEAIAAPGRLIVAPEAFNRFYLDAAHRRVGATWMTREHREADIADYVHYLDGVVAEVCRQASVNPRTVHLTVLGFSQGSETVTRWLDRSALLAHRPGRADGLVLWGNGLPLDLDLNAASWLSSVPLTLVVGDDDAYATPERIAAVRGRLDEASVPYRFVGYAGGHRIEPDVLTGLLPDG